MKTECTQVMFEFHGLFQRKVKARFDGGTITSDAGALLLREVEKRTGLLAGFAECFRDRRDPRLIEHTVGELLGQRVYGLCLGYEDLNDHDQLRTDPLGEDRRWGAQERYKKIVMDGDAIDRWMADTFITAHEAAPEEIVSTPTAPGPYSSGTLPRMPDHRMLDFRALWKESPCGSPGSRRVRSLAF